MQKVLCLKSDVSSIIDGYIVEGMFYLIRLASTSGKVEAYSMTKNGNIEWYMGVYSVDHFIDLADYRDKQIDEIFL